MCADLDASAEVQPFSTRRGDSVAIFGKRSRMPDPDDDPLFSVDRLAAHGRFEWAPTQNPTSGIRIDQVYFAVQDDRDAMLRRLAAIALPVGGWAALGAKYVVTDVLPIETDTPEFNAIVLAGLQFLRQNNVPPNRLSQNDRDLWRRVGPGVNWLDWREAPSSAPQPLQPGERRQVARIRRADGHANEVFVRADGAGFVAEVVGPTEDGTPSNTPFTWHSAPVLRDLYVRVGESLQVPPEWTAADMALYIPLPPCTI